MHVIVSGERMSGARPLCNVERRGCSARRARRRPGGGRHANPLFTPRVFLAVVPRKFGNSLILP
eukprot:6526133-Prymnesium_polylepis.1